MEPVADERERLLLNVRVGHRAAVFGGDHPGGHAEAARDLRCRQLAGGDELGVVGGHRDGREVDVTGQNRDPALLAAAVTRRPLVLEIPYLVGVRVVLELQNPGGARAVIEERCLGAAYRRVDSSANRICLIGLRPTSPSVPSALMWTRSSWSCSDWRPLSSVIVKTMRPWRRSTWTRSGANGRAALRAPSGPRYLPR